MITKPKFHVWLFWAIDIAALYLSWRLLPTVGSQIALTIALVIIIVFSLFNLDEPLNIGTFVFATLLANYLQVTYELLPLLVSILTGAIVMAIGFVADENLQRHNFHILQLINWLCLAFLTAQAQALISYWPVSLFSRTLLLMIIFYGLWQMFRFNDETNRLSWILHFAYIGVTAIVVIGTIIWANFPQLIPF